MVLTVVTIVTEVTEVTGVTVLTIVTIVTRVSGVTGVTIGRLLVSELCEVYYCSFKNHVVVSLFAEEPLFKVLYG